MNINRIINKKITEKLKNILTIKPNFIEIIKETTLFKRE